MKLLSYFVSDIWYGIKILKLYILSQAVLKKLLSFNLTSMLLA